MCAGAFHTAACLVEQAQSEHDVNNAFKKIRVHAPFLSYVMFRDAQIFFPELPSSSFVDWSHHTLPLMVNLRFFCGELPTLLVVRSCHIMSYHVISCHIMSYHVISCHTSSTAQGGGGSFKNRKPIGEVGCCESWRMAERSH